MLNAFVLFFFIRLQIIDTFSDLRSQRDEKTSNKETTCFICGIGRDQFDQEGLTDFKRHCAYEHNKWHYLFYLIHCQLLNEEEPDDINAYERFVLNSFLEGDISWMPLGKALTMSSGGGGNMLDGEGDAGGGEGGDEDNGDVKETVESMKEDLLELTKQMNGMSTQMSLLISKLNLK